MSEDKVSDRLRTAVEQLGVLVNRSSERALNRAILINEMSVELETLYTDVEAKENALLEKEAELFQEEVEEESEEIANPLA